MSTRVLCFFFMSRRPWSWVVLSRRTNGPLARCGFVGFTECASFCATLCPIYTSEFFQTGCILFFKYSPTLLCVCIQSGRTFPQPSFNWLLLLLAFFVPGNAHQCSRVLADFSRVRPTGDVAPQHHRYSPVCLDLVKFRTPRGLNFTPKFSFILWNFYLIKYFVHSSFGDCVFLIVLVVSIPRGQST